MQSFRRKSDVLCTSIHLETLCLWCTQLPHLDLLSDFFFKVFVCGAALCVACCEEWSLVHRYFGAGKERIETDWRAMMAQIGREARVGTWGRIALTQAPLVQLSPLFGLRPTKVVGRNKEKWGTFDWASTCWSTIDLLLVFSACNNTLAPGIFPRHPDFASQCCILPSWLFRSHLAPIVLSCCGSNL